MYFGLNGLYRKNCDIFEFRGATIGDFSSFIYHYSKPHPSSFELRAVSLLYTELAKSSRFHPARSSDRGGYVTSKSMVCKFLAGAAYWMFYIP
jgi:hypothetical protein